jgi:chromosomal replication initiator protein
VLLDNPRLAHPYICRATRSSTSSYWRSKTATCINFRIATAIVDLLVIDDIHFLAGPRSNAGRVFPHVQHTLSAAQADHFVGRLPAERNPRAGRTAGEPIQLGPCGAGRKAVLRNARGDFAKEGPHARPDTAGRRRLLYRRPRWKTTRANSKAPITKIQGMANVAGTAVIDLELAKAALGDSITAEQKRITIQHILDAVTKYYNVKPERPAEQKASQEHRLSPAGLHVSRPPAHPRYSLEEIGGYFGGRDHTTVMHAVRTVDAMT